VFDNVRLPSCNNCLLSDCLLQYILKREVAKFEVDHIHRGTALGELDHPNYASRYFKCMNLPNISHQVRHMLLTPRVFVCMYARAFEVLVCVGVLQILSLFGGATDWCIGSMTYWGVVSFISIWQEKKKKLHSMDAAYFGGHQMNSGAELYPRSCLQAGQQACAVFAKLCAGLCQMQSRK